MNAAATKSDGRSFHEQMTDALDIAARDTDIDELDITIDIEWESDVCELKPKAILCDWCGAQMLGPWREDFATCAACGNESHRS